MKSYSGKKDFGVLLVLLLLILYTGTASAATGEAKIAPEVAPAALPAIHIGRDQL